MWRAIDGVSRAPLGYVLGDRTDVSLKKLIKKVDDGSCIFVTDDWAGFSRVLPQKRHFVGKDLTFPIEATNSDMRHRIARFHRRSKVTSRSRDMIHKTIKLFEHFNHQENLENALKPLMSFFG
ncbi:MAG: hypothetical protein GY915_00070 [bacterium]|nr:hypothetical protein [bacterium]